jgi:hypothetical protein
MLFEGSRPLSAELRQSSVQNIGKQVKEGLFISHIGEEKLLAARIKDFMREVFGTQ